MIFSAETKVLPAEEEAAKYSKFMARRDRVVNRSITIVFDLEFPSTVHVWQKLPDQFQKK